MQNTTHSFQFDTAKFKMKKSSGIARVQTIARIHLDWLNGC